MSKNRYFYQSYINLSPLDAYAFAHEMTHQLQQLLTKPEDVDVGKVMTATARSFEMLGLALWENHEFETDEELLQQTQKTDSAEVISLYLHDHGKS
jgi:hypothetical protein